MNLQTQLQAIAAARPVFPDEDIAAIQADINAILKSGQLILGQHTRHFEQEFKADVGVDHAVAVSTCTAAIQIMLRFHQVQGREIILPTNNFIGVVGAVIAEGAIPVLAEMDAATFCIDTEDLIKRMNPQTAGVIVVHLAGLVYPDIDRIRQICRSRGIFLLEDASHAHGALIGGRKAGSLADAGCFSFYPTKIMTTGTGGMLTTNVAKLADFARSVRHHGVAGSGEVVNLGNDWCLSEIHAVLGRYQLKRLNEHLAHRNRIAALYRQGLGHLPWLTIPACPQTFLHAYYKFPMLLGEGLNRDRFRRMLFEDYQIENGAIYDPPCHLQPVLRNMFAYQEGLFPVAEATLKRQICPPMHSALSDSEVGRVIDAICAAGKTCGF